MKREDRIKELEAELELVKDQNSKCVDVVFNGKVLDYAEFNDEQPEIVTPKDYKTNLKNNVPRTTIYSSADMAEANLTGWEERGKCFQPLVNEIDRIVLKKNSIEFQTLLKLIPENFLT